MKRFLLRGTIALTGAAAIALGAWSTASADDAHGMSAAVGGIPDPTAGQLTVEVRARDTVGRLANAFVSVDGAQVAQGSLCPGSGGTACQAETAEIPFDTTAIPDGTHHIVVTLTDADGNAISVFDENYEFLNHPATGSPSATLNISSGDSPQQSGSGGGGSGGRGGVAGESASSCTSPKLSMQLAQKPVRISKGVPVLVKNKRYRFSGRVTCLIGGKRSSAPARTRVTRNDVVKGKRALKSGTLVRSKGAIAVIVSVASSRSIEFRVTTADGKTSKVTIRVIVQKKGKG